MTPGPPSPSTNHPKSKNQLPTHPTLNGTVDGLHQDTGDAVRVGVAGGPAVLKVAAALGGDFAGDADRRAAVGDTTAELG